MPHRKAAILLFGCKQERVHSSVCGRATNVCGPRRSSSLHGFHLALADRTANKVGPERVKRLSNVRDEFMSFASLVFTPLVKKLQERYGSRRQYARMEDSGGSQDRFTDFELEFLAQRDSFYLATVGSTGWPYVQHRGGPKGFLKVIDDHTLAFADLRGNKQYISTGNLQNDSRVAMIMVDYPRQARLKILGRVEIFEGDQAESWLPKVRVPEEKTPIERVFVIHVEAYDWNCPQHITPRFSAEEIREGMQPIEQHVQKLEEENRALRQELAQLKGKASV
jgi:uncharacterized protein